MATKDKRVDVYIDKAQPYAQPILRYLREVVHEACPDVQETIKWRMPSFEYEGLLCGMAAFKQHCTFGLWKHDLVFEKALPKEKEAMGSFGKIKETDDLPSKASLIKYIKKGMKLNEAGVTRPREKSSRREEIVMHPEFELALRKSPRAKKAFDAFAPGQQREYLEWIATAKKDETRASRVKTAIEWLSEGKRRNWKYENC